MRASSPEYALTRAVFVVVHAVCLTLDVGESKRRRFMPAYSQSKISTRSPVADEVLR